MSHGRNDVVEALRAHYRDLNALNEQREYLLKGHDERRAALAKETETAGAELAEVILPVLTADALAQANRLTGDPTMRESRLADREEDRRALTARLAEIDADPRWRDRELLRAPRVGTVTRKLDELLEFRNPAKEMLLLAEHPRLDRLLEVGYGTDRYAIPWWRWSYYEDWKAGDEIAERFIAGPRKTFAELAPDLAQARADLPVFERQIAELLAEIARGVALEREHADVERRLATVEERHLALAHQRITQYLASFDPADLGDRLNALPDLMQAWRRYAGLAAKGRYLDALMERELRPAAEALRQEIDKTLKDIGKWSQPKMAGGQLSDEQWQKRFGAERATKRRRILERHRQTYDTVWSYDRWDRTDLVGNFLWWDVMTDGKLDGDFIPEVQEWRAQHPRHERDPWDRDDSAAAAATASAPDTHDSSRDPS